MSGVRTRTSLSAAGALLLVVALLLPLATAAAETDETQPLDASSDDRDPYEIALRSRTFTPDPGFDEIEAIANQRLADVPETVDPDTILVHYFLQFEELLPAAVRPKLMAGWGVDLLDYVSGRTYIAVSTIEDLKALPDAWMADETVRWVGPIRPVDKTAPELRERPANIGPWAWVDDDRFAVTVQAHRSVTSEELEQFAALVKAHGGQVLDVASITRTVTAAVDGRQQVDALVAADPVQYVAVAEPALEDEVDVARDLIGVDPLWESPYELDGSGVTALVYETWVTDPEHPDFEGRVVDVDTPGWDETLFGGHATHVAGIILGDGANSAGTDSFDDDNPGNFEGEFAGIAPGAQLRGLGFRALGGDSFDDPGAREDALKDVIEAGFDIANMSSGSPVRRRADEDTPPPCHQLGVYTTSAIMVDELITGAVDDITFPWIMSAGNERGSVPDPWEPCDEYGTINSPKTAKNSISVGNVWKTTVNMVGRSSWGPTNDGRIKPELVAPGCNILAPTYEDEDDAGNELDPPRRDGYEYRCGTSMAAPVVTGVGALLLEQWRDLHGEGAEMAPHTLRSVLVHTADDDAGGDVTCCAPTFEYGWGLVDPQAAVDLVQRDADADHRHLYVDEIDHDGRIELSIPSDGNEPPRVTLSWDDPPGTAIAARSLVNDLDLRLVDPNGTTYWPWVLDPENPNAERSRGNDNTNIIEVVEGDEPVEGTWRVIVLGAGVPSGPQEFTIASDDPLVQAEPPTIDASAKAVIVDEGQIAENSGTYKDPAGGEVILEASVGVIVDEGEGAWSWSYPTLDGPADSQIVEVSVTTQSDGLSGVAEFPLTVHNVPPDVEDGEQTWFGEDTVIQTGFVDPGMEDGEFTATATCFTNWPDPLDPVEVTVHDVVWIEALRLQMGLVSVDCPAPDADEQHRNSPYHVEIAVTDPSGDTGVGTVVLEPPGEINPTPEEDFTIVTREDFHEELTLLADLERSMQFEIELDGLDGSWADVSWDFGDGTTVMDRHHFGDDDGGAGALLLTASEETGPLPELVSETVSVEHTWEEVGLYRVELTVVYEQGLELTAVWDAIVIGDADELRGAGYWQSAADSREQSLDGELEVVAHMSAWWFGDDIDVQAVLHPASASGDMQVQLERHLLTAWLNFAAGAIGLDDPVDTTGDGQYDDTFLELVDDAEAALEVDASDAELEAYKDTLEALVTDE